MVGRAAGLFYLLAAGATAVGHAQRGITRFSVTFPAARTSAAQDGRLLVLISADSSAEPRFQIEDGLNTQLVFGIDVDGLRPGQAAIVDARAFGYPIRALQAVPAGRYRVQALLNRYETFHRADGFTIKVPPDRGEGQQWNSKPGNFYSKPQWITLDPNRAALVPIVMDQEIPERAPPADTKYVRHERIQSKLLSAFWGKPMFLGANVLLPEGWAAHPNARYPLAIYHGHFPADLSGWRETAPDPNIAPVYSERSASTGWPAGRRSAPRRGRNW